MLRVLQDLEIFHLYTLIIILIIIPMHLLKSIRDCVDQVWEVEQRRLQTSISRRSKMMSGINQFRWRQQWRIKRKFKSEISDFNLIGNLDNIWISRLLRGIRKLRIRERIKRSICLSRRVKLLSQRRKIKSRRRSNEIGIVSRKKKQEIF